MTLMDKIRAEIRAGRIPPIFNGSDLKAASIEDPNYNRTTTRRTKEL
jgi:hypothetical protein